jgi:MFS transporter, ACS family, glucarate transporter
MMPALSLTQVQMGYVFSAFVLGYALCQLPGGWLGDRLGAHKVLTAAVLWWSLFTALTAAVGGVISWPWGGVAGTLLVVRFLVGVGEAAALPNSNRTVAKWFASGDRGAGMGISIAGIGVGGAITPPICAWLMVNFGWQSAFYVSGAAGILIALAWAWYATDRPEQHRHVNDAELRHIRGQDLLTPLAPSAGDEPVPWRGFLYTPTVWWLVLSYTGLRLYRLYLLVLVLSIPGQCTRLQCPPRLCYASGPFVAMALCCPLGGWLSDRLAGALGLNQGRA